MKIIKHILTISLFTPTRDLKCSSKFRNFKEHYAIPNLDLLQEKLFPFSLLLRFSAILLPKTKLYRCSIKLKLFNHCKGQSKKNFMKLLRAPNFYMKYFTITHTFLDPQNDLLQNDVPLQSNQ